MMSVCRQMIWLDAVGGAFSLGKCGPMTFCLWDGLWILVSTRSWRRLVQQSFSLIDGSWIGKDKGGEAVGAAHWGGTTPFRASRQAQKLADCSTGQTVCKSQLDERRADLPYPIILVILGHAMDDGSLVWADLRMSPGWISITRVMVGGSHLPGLQFPCSWILHRRGIGKNFSHNLDKNSIYTCVSNKKPSQWGAVEVKIVWIINQMFDVCKHHMLRLAGRSCGTHRGPYAYINQHNIHRKKQGNSLGFYTHCMYFLFYMWLKCYPESSRISAF